MVDEDRADVRLVRPVTASRLLDLPRSDIGRGPLQVAIDFAERPLLWSAQRLDLAYTGPGTYRFLHLDPNQKLVGRLPIPATRLSGPHLVRTPTGWLVYAARARSASDDNCLLFNVSGERVQAFHAGDAIDDLQVTAGGAIWVTYGDEGRSGAVSPVSREGLVRFSPTGSVEYAFNEDARR